jgi:hypothetical protein
MLRQREEWIRFSYSNEDTKDEERRKGWVVKGRLNVVASAKPAPLSQDHATTLEGESGTSLRRLSLNSPFLVLEFSTLFEIRSQESLTEADARPNRQTLP